MSADQVVGRRRLPAPPERAWEAWTRPQDVERWWGPAGWTAPDPRMDVRVGGASRVVMRSPEGVLVRNLWTYRRVEPPRLLEFTMDFCDPSWRVVDPTELGLPAGIPVPVRHVVTFVAAGDGATDLTVTEHGYTSPEAHAMSLAGLEQVLTKLEAVLAQG